MMGCRRALLLALVCAALAAWAQPQPQPPWDTCMQAGRNALMAGRAADAIAAFEGAVKEAAAFPVDDARTIESYLALAKAQSRAGFRETADGVVNKLLVLHLKAFGLQDARLVKTYLTLGDYYRETSGTEQALPQYQKALGIARRVYGEKDPRLADVYLKIGSTTREVAMLLAAVQVIEDANGESAELLPTLKSLAELLVQYRKQDAIGTIYLRMLRITEKQYGAEDERTQQAVNSLYYYYRNAGTPLKMLPLAERLVALMTKRNGIASAQYMIRELAQTQQQLGDVEKAEATLTGLLDGILAAGLQDEMSAISAARMLGDFYLSQERYPEAEKTLAQVAAAMEKRGQRDGEATVGFAFTSLIAVYQAQGKAEQAAPYIEKIKALLPAQEGRYGKNAPHLAPLYLAVGDYATAERLYKQLIANRDHEMFRDNPITADSFLNLGDTYLQWGKPADAEKPYTQALQIMAKVTAVEHPAVIPPLLKLARSLLAQNKPAEADAACARALAIAEKACPNGRLHARTLLLRAAVLRKAGKAAEAEQAAAKAQGMAEKP